MRTTALVVVAVLGACDQGVPAAKKPVEIKNGIRMTFSLAEGSPEAAAAVMQKRLDAMKVIGNARADGKTVVVDVAPRDPEAMGHVRELVTRVGKLELAVVDDGSPLMRGLAKRIREDAGAQERGIRDEVDHWQTDSGEPHDDAYLTARDREEMMSIDEAKARGCLRNPEAGSVRCMVSGREQLARYVGDTALLYNITIPADHALAYELVARRSDVTAPYWRSYYVKKASPIGADAIASAWAVVGPRSEPVIVVKLRDDAAKALAELTGAIVGKKLAVILDDRVTTAPIVMSKNNSGRIWLARDLSASDTEATFLAGAIASGPLPGHVREESAFELKDGKVNRPPAN